MAHSSVAPTARVLALILMIVGAVTMVIAIFADRLGVGGGGEGFGWKQLIAAIAGLMLLLVGIAWLFRPLAGIEPEEPPE